VRQRKARLPFRPLLFRFGGEEQRIAFALAKLGGFLRLGLGNVRGIDRDPPRRP